MMRGAYKKPAYIVGDKVRAVQDGMDLILGNIYTISEIVCVSITEDAWFAGIEELDPGMCHYSCDRFVPYKISNEERIRVRMEELNA